MKKVLLFVFLSMFGFSVFASAMDKVNINTATAAELEAGISGVGDKTADLIIQYREMHGKFKSIDELAKIKGIGTKILEKNKDHLTVE